MQQFHFLSEVLSYAETVEETNENQFKKAPKMSPWEASLSKKANEVNLASNDIITSSSSKFPAAVTKQKELLGERNQGNN